MAYIEIYNDANTILINDTAQVHRLVQSGTVAATQGFAMWSVASATRTASLAANTLPIVAFSPTSNTTGVFMSLHQIASTTPGTYTWTYATGRESVSGNYDYFMFQDGVSDPMAGTGLVVCRNENNVVVFDSDANYANMVDVVTVPLDGSVVNTYPAGRRYAVANVVPLVRRVSSQGGGGGWNDVYPIGFSINGSQIRFQHYWARHNASGSFTGDPVGNSVAATFIVFDVTGL